MAARDELLAKSKMTDAEFRDYVTKHHTFFSGLNDKQKAFYKEKNKKTLKEVLGRDVTADDLTSLFKEAPHDANMMMAVSCCENGGVSG